MDPQAMSLFAVSLNWGHFRRYRWRWSISVGVLATLPIASVFTFEEDVMLRCAARLSIPACAVSVFSVLPAIIGMAAWTHEPQSRE